MRATEKNTLQALVTSYKSGMASYLRHRGKEEGIKQGSATFPESRAKNKLCKVWRAVLIFHQQFHSFAVVKSWEFMDF